MVITLQVFLFIILWNKLTDELKLSNNFGVLLNIQALLFPSIEIKHQEFRVNYIHII